MRASQSVFYACVLIGHKENIPVAQENAATERSKPVRE